MSQKKSGQQIAKENIELVRNWIEKRNELRDWERFSYNNRINRSVLATELKFAKSVCTQNKTVRDLLEQTDSVWFRNSAINNAAQEAAHERVEKQLGQSDLSNDKLIRRVAELEAELYQLRKELVNYH